MPATRSDPIMSILVLRLCSRGPRGRTILFLAAMVFAASAVDAQAPDVLRGHVRGIGNAVLAGAQVTATLAGEPARTTRTDGQGAYSISFTNANGPYSLAVAMVGYAAMTKQVPARAPGAIRVDIDFQLEPVA